MVSTWRSEVICENKTFLHRISYIATTMNTLYLLLFTTRTVSHSFSNDFQNMIDAETELIGILLRDVGMLTKRLDQLEK